MTAFSPATVTTPTETITYGYGVNGRTESVVDNRGTTSLAYWSGTKGYNAANMLLSRAGNAYTNDADGNTLTGGGRTNTWDSQNRLATCVNGATTSNFVYGADGIRRQATIVNGASTTVTDSVLDSSMLVREQRAGSNFATYFVGARGSEYRRDDTKIDGSSGLPGVTSWYLYDGLGSVLGEVDPNGNITSSRKYDVYGLVRGGNNSGGTSSQKFVGALGHISEDSTGLTYMRARYMDPFTGRFASEDSAQSGENWFTYCENNPINRSDPSGHFSLVMLLWGGVDSDAVEAAEAKMAQYFASWGENKVAQALCIWAGKFAKEIMEEEVDGVEWTANNNLRITGVGGNWEIRLDFSGHHEMPPHINYATNGGGTANSVGNHWIITR